jgi:hypothetical protein
MVELIGLQPTMIEIRRSVGAASRTALDTVAAHLKIPAMLEITTIIHLWFFVNAEYGF